MDRRAWLDERQAAVRAAYDDEAATYDEHGYPADTQHDWMARLLRLVPAGGTGSTRPAGPGATSP